MAESKPLRKFRYTFGKGNVTFSSKSSSTVLNALLTDDDFKKTYTATGKDVKDVKDVIIQRIKPRRPAISVNFPCCLLEDEELLKICFIKRDPKSPGPNTEECDLHKKNPKELTTFLVSTTGGKGIQNLVMENKNLKSEVKRVCVVAVKGETVKKALRRDGRFDNRIFKMDLALEDNEDDKDKKNRTKMKNSVNELKDHKLYIFFRKSREPMPDSQEMQNSKDVLEDQPQSNFEADPGPSQVSNAQSSGKALLASDKKEMTTSKSDHTKYEELPKEILNILNILRARFDGLAKQLKARENVKTPAKVRQLLREEFSKETQCFSLIKTVKTLMDLSASVCQVRHNGQALGTGFLLFEKCILTNAHLIRNAGREFLNKLSVSFDFEDLNTPNKQFAIKKNPLAYEYKYSLQHSMDYALLELESDEASELDPSAEASESDSSAEGSESDLSAEESESDSSAEESESDSSAEGLLPPLLQYYRAAPVGKGVCIIGHPAVGVKKIDTCLIIERSKQEAEADKYIYGYIGGKYFEEGLDLGGNQIEYNTCFFEGASGSPVFDEDGNVIGMHTGGYAEKKGKEPFHRIIQFAHPLQPILVSIYSKLKDNPSSVCKSLCAEIKVMLADDKTFHPDDVDMG